MEPDEKIRLICRACNNVDTIRARENPGPYFYCNLCGYTVTCSECEGPWMYDFKCCEQITQSTLYGEQNAKEES